MSETPLTQEMIDTPPENGNEKTGLYATVSKHPFVTGGLVLAGAGLAYTVSRLVTASREEEITGDVPVETSGERGDNTGEDQQPGQPQDRRFEKAKTGAVAVTGNIEQGAPQQHSSPRDDRNRPVSATAPEKETDQKQP